MKVKVTDGWQVKHNGTHYTGGDTFDAPENVVQKWIDSGLVKKVAASPNKAQTSSANKASTTTKAKAKS